MIRRWLILTALLTYFSCPLAAQEKGLHEVVTTDSLTTGTEAKEKKEIAERVPEALVERIQTVGETTTRISLFNNRVAVVTMRDQGAQFFFRKWTLGEAEYSVYLKALSSCAHKAGLSNHEDFDNRAYHARIYLHLSERPSRHFSYSPLQVQDLATSRLTGILDDIQERVSSLPPSAEVLQHWRPKEGDRVELFNGSFAIVDEIRGGGVIVLQYEETSILEVVPYEAWSHVIFRILP